MRRRTPLAAAMVSALTTVLVAGCGSPAKDAPTDASLEDFCAAKDWFVEEGMTRLAGGDGPPSEDDVAALARDWAEEFTKVGTPDNMSTQAREGFEKFVDRVRDLEGGEMASFGWTDGEWEGEAEESFANYVTNSC